ncbi:MAG: BamA/TamA family outer membrane protein [Chitinophagia bacterium]
MQKPFTCIILFILSLSLYYSVKAQNVHRLEILCTDKVTAPWPDKLKLPASFKDKDSCKAYLANTFLPFLQREGYLESSVDSLSVDNDLTRAWVHLGDQYTWGELKADSSLVLFMGLPKKKEWVPPGRVLNMPSLNDAREKSLSLLEENGYPFAAVKIDSSYFINNALYARMHVEKGPLYHIDSITVEGKIRISRNFLHRYLSIPQGDIYRKSSLQDISRRLSLLGYLRETRSWGLDLLGSGSTLNLYLEQQRNSRFNLLAGLMPANQQIGGKVLLTGEAELDLKNGFGGGEELSILWQQIQVKSPRLKLAFNKPYLFNSQAGVDFKFDLLRKDSSFINIQTRLGVQYVRDPRNNFKIFFQQNNSSLIDVDTMLIKRTRRLPDFLDLRSTSIGVEWQMNKTDDIFNPRKGSEISLSFSGGMRKIIPNSNILGMTRDYLGKPFAFSSLYDTIRLQTAQFRFSTRVNKFIRIGKQSTLKTGMQAGWMEGSRLLLNELFQLGGIKTLRGFDEEFLYASRYFIGTLEYRYLIAQASYLFSFIDYGRLSRPLANQFISGNYAGVGFGISLETKGGQFNLAYAAGKNKELPFNFREAKLHFGFVSLF